MPPEDRRPAATARPVVVGDPSAITRPSNAAMWRGVDQAHLMGLELIVAVLLWAGVGWLIDGWLNTGWWFTVLGAMVGNAAGVYLVWLRSQRMDARDAAEAAWLAAAGDRDPTADTQGRAGGR